MPRAGLSGAKVVEAAGCLADEVGLSRLTLAELADRLGVRQPSLYKHVAGLAAVRRALSVQARHELAAVIAQSTAGLSRADALRAMATAYLDWATRRPGLYAATQSAADPADAEEVAASEAAIAAVFDALRGYRLDDAARVDAVRTLRAVVHGFVGLGQAGGFKLERSVDASLDWALAALDAAMSESAAAG